MSLGKWKAKRWCSQVVQALLIFRWLPSPLTWGVLQECADHPWEARLICHHIFHPQSLFCNQVHISAHTVKIQPLPISTKCACVPFTSQNSVRIGTGYTALHHLHEGLWGPSWGWIHNYTLQWNSASSRDLLEVSVQLSKRPYRCTWEQQLFPFGSKKTWLSLWDRKTASPDCIFTL